MHVDFLRSKFYKMRKSVTVKVLQHCVVAVTSWRINAKKEADLKIMSKVML